MPYVKTAANLLGYPELAEYVEWIGTPGKSGSGEYTGDSNLKAALKFLRANTAFTKRVVIALFDCDANQADEHFENVHVISLEQIADAAVEDGIENLLPTHVFTPDVFQEKPKPSGIVGKPNIINVLRKTHFSEKLCGNNAEAANFKNFEPYLSRINDIVNPSTEDEGAPTPESSTDPTALSDETTTAD